MFNVLNVQDAAPRRVQLAVAGFAAAALLAAQMPAEAKDVKTVVCASNPTSKICLKVGNAASRDCCSFHGGCGGFLMPYGGHCVHVVLQQEVSICSRKQTWT